ncbi:MAG: tetratricopeptide repeat protein [Atopobiaceae bacterium]|nr:tetratricopeptide repeat protein [Atopobiaceae bacterium]
MDQQAYDLAKDAYQRGDWASALAALDETATDGATQHLRGNTLMKLGLYADAAQAYKAALDDVSYGKVGALSCNRGRALLAAGDVSAAIDALTTASQDPSYATPYKAYVALGNAQTRRGDFRQAGIAYRNAAIDENNPDPSDSLTKLGKCFMQLGRPVDAIEAFRTALDFSTASQNSIYAELGGAYVAANRMSEAVDAYAHATADGTFELSETQSASFQAASRAVAAVVGTSPSETDALLAAAGFGGGYDPLDPAGSTGEYMPSPEDTGFFEVTENEIMQQEIKKSFRKKRRGCGLKVFLLLLLLAALAGAGAWMYMHGYGWPTQEMVVEQLFKEADSGDIGNVLAPSVSSDERSDIEAILPVDAKISLSGIDCDMNNSSVRVVAALAEGGSQSYVVNMVRDGIGWKVSQVNAEYTSLGEGNPTVSTSGTLDTSTQAATEEAATNSEALAEAQGEQTEDAATAEAGAEQPTEEPEAETAPQE